MLASHKCTEAFCKHTLTSTVVPANEIADTGPCHDYEIMAHHYLSCSC